MFRLRRFQGFLLSLIGFCVPLHNLSAQVCEIPPNYPLTGITVSVDSVYENLLYPQASGWIGGDNAHSIPLSDSEVLWLFSDTLIGTVSSGTRSLQAFINNSIAIHDTSGSPPGTVQYYWDTSSGNNSFFPHQVGTPGQWYWPNAGVLLEGELFIYCNSLNPGGGGFAEIAGTTLIRIPNPDDNPDLWVQNAFDTGLPASLGGEDFTVAATYVEDPYLYILTLTGNGGFGSQGIGRALISDITAGGLGEVFEFWTSGVGGDDWRSSLTGLIQLFPGGVTETEIYYEELLDLYFTFTYNVFDPNLTIRTAPSLTGPWSAEACVYQVPEFQLDPANIIVYEFRSHPELSSAPGELVVSYQTNWIGPNGFNNLFTPAGLDIYYPHFLRLAYHVPLNASTTWGAYH
jgi:hypothetical protein